MISIQFFFGIKFIFAKPLRMLTTFHNLSDPPTLPSVMHLPRMDNNGSRNNPRKLGRKLQWYGHTSRRSGLLAHNIVMHGLVDDARGQGRPKTT